MCEPAIRPMTFEQARECTDAINANLTNLRQLVVDLHDRGGWSALGYASWTECVQKEFKQAERYIFYQYGAAKIELNISDCNKVQLGAIPETHLRPLGKLKDPQQQREVWQRVVATAPGGKVTAAHVSKTVKGMMIPEPTKPSPPPQPTIQIDAIRLAAMAIRQLQLIVADDPNRHEGLRAVRLWIKKNAAGSKPRKKAKKGKIPMIRHRPVGDRLKNQIPLELTPAG